MTDSSYKKSLPLLSFAIVAAPFAAAWQAICYAPLWGWFITPVTGVSVPSLWALAGILLAARIPFSSARKEDPEFNKALFFSLVLPPITLGYGWLFHVLSVAFP